MDARLVRKKSCLKKTSQLFTAVFFVIYKHSAHPIYASTAYL